MVGYAVTCTMDSTTADQKGENRLHEFMDVLWASENPIVVVIQDVGPKTNSSCFAGDLICSVYSALGVVGLVTDGGVRDLKGIKEKAPGLQIFSPGVVVSHGNGIKIDINVPVVVGGMQIDPGDLIHGDGNGLVNVPISIDGIDSKVLDPKCSWNNSEEYDKQATYLAKMFIENFKKYGEEVGHLEQFGPMLVEI